ncbi:SusC/RagA family TonB-linked outer membrane protein [Pedobacter heparinus]|uniref:SusC/RagA family TonB-linked outer membrane protein n=1 Tax=Pedobacter heparinus TaxID=984 RepID=UPI00292EBE1D|nr:SusC/RagA family TonB-linked outer membrane protein [Pedobacter heparinus]
MKLIVVLLTTTILQVSASSFAQRVTINQNNITLAQAFKQLTLQSGYDILYNGDLIKNVAPIDVRIKDASVEEALKQILQNQKLAYSIKDKTIILEEAEPSFLDRVVSAFADINVIGIVVDGETGNVLVGASVKVKGSGKATTTASNGAFYLQGVDEDAIIEISFVGFKSVELKVAKNLGTIKLEVSYSDLNEVEINKGYYTEKRRLSTGSVGRVTADEISRQPVSNPLAALYGRIPGLIITQQTGVPGGNFKVEIRGQNSLRKTGTNNGNIPLYIIDGVPFSSIPMNTATPTNIYPTSTNELVGSSPFDNINPADIESVEVLKDADATAIYGSRGANGVILITTKKGKAGQMQVDANVYSGIGKVTRKMKLLNTDQYLEMRKEAFKNDGIATYPVNAPDINGTFDQNKYTDWQKELIGGIAKNTDAQIGISGGTSNSQYRFGGGYHRESTVFPGNFANQRGSAHLSVSNASPNQKFRSQFNVNYSLGITNLLSNDLTFSAVQTAPNAPDLLDENGNLNWPSSFFYNNQLSFTKQPYDARTNNLIVSSILSYEFLPGLVFKTNMGYINASRKEIAKTPLSSIPPDFRSSSFNSTNFGSRSNNSWNIEPQLSWSKQFHKNTINVLIGSTFEEQNTESLAQSARGFISEALMDDVSAVPNTNVANTYDISKYRYNALFARINYNYDGKYIINLTGRRDGSSRFGPGRQFASFGAIGTAWIFSEEKLIKNNLPVLSSGKIRGSYGITGSDQIPNYAFLDLYRSTSTYDGLQGLGPTQLYNPDFSWEENRKFEIAVELGFLQDRILLTTAWYRNRSSNQLLNYPLPPTAGFPSITTNGDATVQNTGLEFELNTTNIKTKTFSWNSSVNLSIPRNKLISYPNLAGSSYANTYVVGEPLSIVKLYKYIGISQTTGLYQVMDVDNNGIYNNLDRQTIKFIGQKFSGGWNNSLEWKSLQLNFLLQFVKQNGRNYLSAIAQSPGSAIFNQPVEVIKRWQKSGDDTNIQRFTTTNFSSYSNYRESDGVISDASFIRLKNIALSYKLPASILTKMKLKGIRVYAQAQNIMTITKYKGFDPETQGLVLPPLFFVTGGIQLTF